MLDPDVRITRVSDQVGFDPVTTLPTRNKVVEYMVGSHGPFRLVTPADHFTQEYVETETRKTADTLRGLNAIGPKV